MPNRPLRRRMCYCAALLLAGVAVPAPAQILSLTINDALIDLDTRVTLDGGRISVLEGAVATTAAALSAQVTTQANVAASLDARITTHDTSIASLQAASVSVASRITANTAAVGALDGRVAVAETSLADLGAQLSAQAALVAGQGGSAATINTRISQTETGVATLGARTDVLDGRVDAIAGGTAANAVAVVTIGERVDTLAGGVAANRDAIVSLDARTVTQAGAISTLAVQVGDNGSAIARERVRNDQQDVQIADHSARIDAVGSVANTALADNKVLRADVVAGRIGVVQVAADATITVGASSGGNTVSVAGTGGTRRISGVSAGSQADDAATVGQLTSAMASTLGAANLYTDQSILRALDQQMGTTRTLIAQNNAVLRREINGVAAGGAALSGLPQATIPGRGFAGMSLGGKGSEVAIAFGASKAFDGEHAPVLRAGAAIDTRRGDLTYNAGVGFHF